MRKAAYFLIVLFLVLTCCSNGDTEHSPVPEGVSQQTYDALLKIGNDFAPMVYYGMGDYSFQKESLIQYFEDNKQNSNTTNKELIHALESKDDVLCIGAIIVLLYNMPRDEEVRTALISALQNPFFDHKTMISKILAETHPDDEEVIRLIINVYGNTTFQSQEDQQIQTLYNIGPGAIPYLIEGLESNGIGVKQGSAIVLGMFGPQSIDALPGLIKNVEDPNHYVRIASINALAKIGLQPGVIEALTKAAYDDHHEVSNNAIAALTHMGAEGINALIKLLVNREKDGSKARGLAREALRLMIAGGPSGSVQYAKLKVKPNPDVMPILISALNSEDAEIRAAVLKILQENNALTINELPLLMDAVKDESSTVRMYAAMALSEFGEERGVFTTLVTLLDGDSYVAKAAAEALVKIGPISKVIPILISKLNNKSQHSSKEMAQVLGGIGADAAEPLIETFDSGESLERAYAACALGLIGPEPGVLDTLLDALYDEDILVRMKAIEALGNIGAPAGYLLPVIRQMYKYEPWIALGETLSKSVESTYRTAIFNIERDMDESEDDAIDVE